MKACCTASVRPVRSRTPSTHEAKKGALLRALNTASRDAAIVISPAKFKTQCLYMIRTVIDSGVTFLYFFFDVSTERTGVSGIRFPCLRLNVDSPLCRQSPATAALAKPVHTSSQSPSR